MLVSKFEWNKRTCEIHLTERDTSMQMPDEYYAVVDGRYLGYYSKLIDVVSVAKFAAEDML